MRRPIASASAGWRTGLLSWALILTGLIQLVLPNDQVLCQEFEDLNNQRLPQQAHERRLTNGGSNFQFASSQQQQQFSNSRQFGEPQSVVLPSSSVLLAGQQQQQQQQQSQTAVQGQGAGRLASTQQTPVQRASISGRFVSPNVGSFQAVPQFASSQQLPVVAPAPAVSSNVDQIMKSALARSVKLEAEARQDSSSGETPQLRQGASAQQQQATSATVVAPQEKQGATENESSPSGQSGSDASDGATATATTGNHETVYSDQRFASLFARRKTLNKSKFTPVETTRAKPTLPSFIRSPPDPKQFTASDAAESSLTSSRPIAASSATNLASVRPNSNRLGSNPVAAANKNQQQKKATAAALASSSAAAASNKRANSLNGKQLAANANQKTSNATSAKDQKLATVATKPVSNNPFSRGNGNINDPANVIAMARKRLLANNALESGKLRQQQQQKPAVPT